MQPGRIPEGSRDDADIQGKMLNMNSQHHPYADVNIALLTQHGKQRVIGPSLEKRLGCQVHHVDSYDTDQLGTFTRDIPRLGTQMESARKKAHLAIELSGMPCGLGSEGALIPDPYIGMAPWNLELIVFIDCLRDLEVVGMAQSHSNFHHRLIDAWSTLQSFAHKVGFPEQSLVVRPRSEHDHRILKGIDTWPALEAAFAWAVSSADNSLAFIETDGRAHANPLRMANIGMAATDLASKLASLCPACGTPGYWRVAHLEGLPCEACGMPTRETRAQVYGCLKCPHRETRAVNGTHRADPGCCNICNP